MVAFSFGATSPKGEQMIPKGYKHTELGILPQDWEVVRLGEIGKIVGGGTPDTENLGYWTQQNGIVWLTPTEIKTKYITESQRQITKKGLEESSAKQLPKHTILITTRATIGDIGIAKVDCTTNQGFQSLICSDSLSYEYAYYALQAFQIKKHFIRSACGSTFLELSSREVRRTKIPLPPLAEQEKIAEILSTWDTQIQNYESLIKEKQTLKKGLCQTLLTAKTRLKGFSEDWEMKEFEKIFKRIPSKKFQIQTKDYKKNGKYPVVDQGKIKIVAYSDCDEKVLRVSDVILFGDHTREVKYINFDFIVGADGVQLFRSFSENNLFLYYFLSSQCIPNTGYNRHFKFVESMLFPLPSLAEQEKIAETLGEGDREIMLLEQKLESLKSQKKGIMQNLLNGKVRVTQ